MVKDDNMKKRINHELSSIDIKIVDIFSELGVPKNLAKTLMYISQVKECQSSDIERGANLRQPEVSVAMQVLTDLGWISKRNQKKGGKGRPIYIYKLEASLDDIANYYETTKLKQIENIKNDLTELKTLLHEIKKQ